MQNHGDRPRGQRNGIGQNHAGRILLQICRKVYEHRIEVQFPGKPDSDNGRIGFHDLNDQDQQIFDQQAGEPERMGMATLSVSEMFPGKQTDRGADDNAEQANFKGDPPVKNHPQYEQG